MLGEGGMGTVFEGVNDTIHRHVAIKILHAEASASPNVVKRFINEARAVNLIHHPGLVQVTFPRKSGQVGYMLEVASEFLFS